MNTASKNHTISKIAAKAVLRITIIVMAFPIIMYFTNRKMMPEQISFPTKWAVVPPIMLLLLFVALLIMVLKNHYKQTDFNWLLTLNGLFLCLYLVLLYVRVLPLFN